MTAGTGGAAWTWGGWVGGTGVEAEGCVVVRGWEGNVDDDVEVLVRGRLLCHCSTMACMADVDGPDSEEDVEGPATVGGCVWACLASSTIVVMTCSVVDVRFRIVCMR